MFNLINHWKYVSPGLSISVSGIQDTCGVSETCDFSEKEESTMRNNLSIHFQTSCPYHYKGYSLGSSSASISVSGWAGVLDWAPRSRSRVFVPYRHNIKKAPQLSALQRRSGSDGPHKSLPQRRALVHTFTVYRGLGVDILVWIFTEEHWQFCL